MLELSLSESVMSSSFKFPFSSSTVCVTFPVAVAIFSRDVPIAVFFGISYSYCKITLSLGKSLFIETELSSIGVTVINSSIFLEELSIPTKLPFIESLTIMLLIFVEPLLVTSIV